jgi:prepilin-type N-terminal cleavage/methylation domain-containing protein/prepilin-type processing-associated H-X9-DG protein
MKSRNSAKSGFSLIELIVVIAIIGILITLLLPSLAKAKVRQQRTQCMGNLHQLGIALQTVLSNNHGYPMWIENRHSGWSDQLEVEGLGIAQPPKGFMESGVWRCPAAQWPSDYKWARFSYGYNAFGSLRNGNITNSPGLSGHYDPILNRRNGIRETEVVAPADMIAIGESDDFVVVRSQEYDFGKLPVRHQNKVNILLCDGHVESPSAKSLFDDVSDQALNRWNRDHQAHRKGL